MIVLDLEWNTGPRSDAPLDEIIQIGALRLDCLGGKVLDTFCAYIRPSVHKVYAPTVQALPELALCEGSSLDFKTAMADFAQWCGGDMDFATWGSGDLDVLRQNVWYWGLSYPVPEQFTDLQEAFARTLGSRSCIALHRAVEYCRIPDVFDFHNAFYDVLYSALVSEYSSAESLRLSVHRDALCTEDHIIPLGKYGPFANKEEALNDRRCRASRCPRCGKQLWVTKWAMAGDVAYAKVVCTSHGTFLARLSFSHSRRRLWAKAEVQELTMGNRMRWRAAMRKRSFLCAPQRRSRKRKQCSSAVTAEPNQEGSRRTGVCQRGVGR